MKRHGYLLLVILSVFITCTQLQAQVIISVAGKTTEAYLGDGGPAKASHLHWPEAVAFDPSGNLYIADADNNVIRKIDDTGYITTVVGSGFEAGTGTGGFGGDGGAATDAQLNYPSGVAFDALGNMYIADRKNNRVRMVNTLGVISTFAGTGLLGFAGDGAAATAAKLDSPTRVATDGSGNVYIADAGNHCIRKVDNTGTITTVAGTGATSGFSGDGGPANMAMLYSPQDMAIDIFGNMYIADYNNNRIRKVDASGNISTVAGFGIPGFSGDSAAATNANIFLPSGIATDGAGNVFFSDFANARVRRIDATTGIITTFAGNGDVGYGGDNGPSKAAEINFPQGLAIDGNGGIYLADKGNNRIRFISAALGTAQMSNSVAGLSLYPDPNDGNFNVTIASAINEDANITISNMAGQKITELHTRTNTMVAMSIVVPPGVYFLSAVTAHGAMNEKVLVR